MLVSLFFFVLVAAFPSSSFLMVKDIVIYPKSDLALSRRQRCEHSIVRSFCCCFCTPRKNNHTSTKAHPFSKALSSPHHDRQHPRTSCVVFALLSVTHSLLHTRPHSHQPKKTKTVQLGRRNIHTREGRDVLLSFYSEAAAGFSVLTLFFLAGRCQENESFFVGC